MSTFRKCRFVMLALVIFSATAPSGAETAPSLLTSALIDVLQSEVEHFAQVEAQADEQQALVVRASMSVRLLALELLTQGQAAAAETGSASEMLGHRIAAVRAGLDELLIAHLEAVVVGKGESIEPVERFVTGATDLAVLIRTLDIDQLDLAIARIFAPLAEVAERQLGAAVEDHWPTRDEVEGAEATFAPLADRLAEMQGRLATSALGDAVRADLSTTVGMLQRGNRFADLRPRIDRLAREVGRVLDVDETLAASAAWLGEPRTRYRAALEEAASALGDPAIRDRAIETLDDLELTARMLDEIESLSLDAAQRTRLVRIVGEIESASSVGLDREASRRRRTKLLAVLERMDDVRRPDRSVWPGAWKRLFGRLDEAYEVAENDLLESIEMVLVDPRGARDPAVVTLLTEHADRHRDLMQLAQFMTWRQEIGAIDTRLVKPFDLKVRRLFAALPEPMRRDEALDELAEFEQRWTRVRVLPFESSLGASDTDAIALTGGLDAEVALLLQDLRRAWIDAWAQGRDDRDALGRLELARRLLSVMAEGSAASTIGSEIGLLDRWAAWTMPGTLLRRLQADLQGRLVLATTAYVDGHDDEARAQLDRLDREAPLAILIGRLSQALGPALRRRPDGVRGALGQLTVPPTADAWLDDARVTIAALCAHAIEADAAGAVSERQVAATHMARANQLATDLLEAMTE